MRASHSSVPIVEAVGLTKIFRDFWYRPKARAVDNVDFKIDAHEIFGLLGPNGAGKSTIIKMILGLLHKTSGRLSVFNKLPSSVMTKRRIGYLPEESYMYRFLNARETLDFYGKVFGLDGRTRRRRIDELLDMVGLGQVAHRAVGEYSKGMTRRLGLAQALINDPDLLILDEPTSGLDPIGTRQVKDLILELGRRGKTILLSSHLLADVEDVCHRVVVLYGGKIRAQGTVDELLADTQHTMIQAARLNPATISRIEQIILEMEGKAIDRVIAPRQKLEDLFMQIVERARAEQITTSGALHGGQTASFLKGDAAAGEDLIASLSREATERPRVREAVAKAPAPDTRRDDVLSELMGDKPEPRAAKPVAPLPEAPKDVDASVIDSLINDDPNKGAR